MNRKLIELVVLGVLNAAQDAGIVFMIFYTVKCFTSRNSHLFQMGFFGVLFLLAWGGTALFTAHWILYLNSEMAYRQRLPIQRLVACFCCIAVVGIAVGTFVDNYYVSTF